MKTEDCSSTLLADTAANQEAESLSAQLQRAVGRRSFLKGLGVAGATVTAGALLSSDAYAAKIGRAHV